MTTRNIGFRFKGEGKEEVRRDFAEIGQAGKAAGAEVAGAFEGAGKASERLGGYTDAQMARFQKMAQQARQFQTEQERAAASQLKFNAALGVGSGSGLRQSDFLSADEVSGAKGGMTRAQRAGAINLSRQGADIFTGVIGGQSPGMIAAQQGPQILDALATSGFKASASMVAVGVGIAGTAAALITLAAAQASYESSTLKLEVSARGLGAASGQTAEQLAAQARAGAEAGEISVRAARDMAVAYANTGRIGGGVMDELIALTQRYARTTGQDAASATKELGAAFADPVKGAGDLNEKLHFLDAAEQRHIENLARSGREAEAQAILVDKLQASLLSAADATTGWGHALDGLKTAAVNGFDAVGRFVDGIITGGNAVEKLSKARAALASLEGQGDGPIIKELRAQAQAEIDKARKDFVAEMDALRDRGLSQRSTDRQRLVDQYNPSDAKLASLKADREKLLGLGVNDAASRTALKELDDQIKALGAGYKTAAQQAAALARESRRAATQAAKDAREQAKDVREAAREMAELSRRKAAAADHALDQERKLATIRGDVSALDFLGRQAALQQEINRYLAEGLSIEEARVKARAQITAEMQAENEVLRAQRSNPEGFVSAADRMKDIGGFEAFDAKAAFLEDLRIETGQSFHDGLVAGMTDGDFFGTFTSRLKYAAAVGLADGLTDAAFGKKSGGGGLFSKAASFGISLLSGGGGGGGNGDALASAAALLSSNNAKLVKSGYAKGTQSAVEGYAWVGEEGPELRKLRAGDEIKTNQASLDMVRQANARAAVAAAPVVVNATFAPVLTVGAGADAEEVARLRAELKAMKDSFKSDVTNIVNDGLARRTIKGGG